MALKTKRRSRSLGEAVALAFEHAGKPEAKVLLDRMGGLRFDAAYRAPQREAEKASRLPLDHAGAANVFPESSASMTLSASRIAELPFTSHPAS